MRVKPFELKYIQSRIPSALTVLNEDLSYLQGFQKSLRIKIYAITLWEKWLTHDEYEELFYCSIEVEQLRLEKFISLYSYLLNHCKNIYTWRYDRRKQRNEIRKLTVVKQRKFKETLNNYTVDFTRGIFELIIPEYSAVLKMGSDWTCHLICSEEQDNRELFQIIEKSGLKYFENKYQVQ